MADAIKVQQVPIAGMFTGMADVKVTRKSKYLSGNVAIMITRVKFNTSSLHEVAMIFEGIVLRPYEDKNHVAFNEAGYDGLRPCEEVSIYIKATGNRYLRADTKKVLEALFPESPEITAEDTYLVAGYDATGTIETGEQPAFGLTLRYFERAYKNAAGEDKRANEYAPSKKVSELIEELNDTDKEFLLNNASVLAVVEEQMAETEG